MDVLPKDASDAIPPRFGFGASGLGNLGREISDSDAHATLDAAWAAGFRYYDTSPLYGYGLSELRLGQFLRAKPRKECAVSTKVGRYLVAPNGKAFDEGIWKPPLPLMPVLDYSYDGTMRSLEQSHSRMGLDVFDIIYIHDIDRRNHGTRFDDFYKQSLEGAYKALESLRSSGFVKKIGIGVNESDVAADFIRDADIDLVMLAGRYSLLDHDALNDCLPAATAREVGVVAVGVFNSGILATGAKPGATYDYGLAPKDVLDRVNHLERICQEHGVPLAAAAIQFPLAHPCVVGTVLGMSRVESVRRTVGLTGESIPAAFWSQLKSEGLIPDAAAVPQ